MASIDVPRALKDARTTAGLNQAELAERAGVGRMTVQQIETGVKDPRLSTLLVLARALGLDLILVPSVIRSTVEDFVRSGGKIVGQPSGTTAPPSIVDEIRVKLSKSKP